MLGSVAAAVQGEDGGGQAAEWAREGQKLRVSAAAREKLDKLKIFESDLAMLGLTAEMAIEMDERALRKVFRRAEPRAPPGRRRRRRGADGVRAERGVRGG